MQSAAIFVPF